MAKFRKIFRHKPMRLFIVSLSVLTLIGLHTPAWSEDSVAYSMQAMAKPLLKAISLIGTPYRFGGNKPEKGVDCSGFVRLVYKESADITLPRTARDMSQVGEQVDAADLKPGDLVFFNTRKSPNSHVGIYAGNDEFIHASSRRAREVTISRLKDSYWSTRFNGARRVLSGQ